jgi:uncharacterized membrane protein YdfJ with MMPL/SSD domain
MVPAIVVLCGRWNWWPSKLSRREAQIPPARAGAGVLRQRGD